MPLSKIFPVFHVVSLLINFRSMSITVLPSLPASSFAEIEALASTLKGVVSDFQVDLVDGAFAPFVSWPFTESDPLGTLQNLRELAGDFTLEIDCMVMQPEQYLDQFVVLGAKRIIVHLGSTEAYEDIFRHRDQCGYKLGFASTSATPVAEMMTHIPQLDFVQFMGIREVGQQGQPFDEDIIPHIVAVRSAFPELEIMVDGSVNATTIPALVEAGVTRLAPGSAIAKQSDPLTAYHELTALANSIPKENSSES